MNLYIIILITVYVFLILGWEGITYQRRGKTNFWISLFSPIILISTFIGTFLFQLGFGFYYLIRGKKIKRFTKEIK